MRGGPGDTGRFGRRLQLVVTGVVAGALGLGVGLFAVGSPPPTTIVDAAPSPASGPTEAETPLTFTVDPALVPAVAQVDALDDGGPPRPVGRLRAPDGTVTDLVLSELVVTTTDPDRVEAFVRRYDGEIVDEFPAEDGEPTDYLVRIQPPEPDLTRFANDLAALEPDQQGRFTAGDDGVLALMAVAAAETDDDFLIGLNWVAASTGIEDATSREAPKNGAPRDAFTWPYIASGTAQDIGVDVAWRLLAGSGKLENRVRVLVVDSGFQANPDFPEGTRIVEGDWGEAGGTCSGGTPCPWHGTDVTVALAGRLDNDYGAAGPAAPVAELYLFQDFADSWKTLRRVKKTVGEKHIDVVNMSFGWEVTVFRKASEQAAERHLGKMVDSGAIVFAAAGNDGENVDALTCRNGRCRESSVNLPCETEAVICVGGMDWDTPAKADGSNYGSKTDGRTVEIYGPYCVYSIKDPANGYSVNDVERVCGTSFASPFVAGVAALVKAADPDLGPPEIWQTLRDTAHVGGLGLGDGFQWRVNAAAAVARALGVEPGPPQVTIAQPADGTQFDLNEFPEFAATATEFTGLGLPILWTSSIDGPLGDEPSFEAVTAPGLSPGVHTITATATDVLGVQSSAQITVEIVDEPPQVSISWPQPGTKFYEGTGIELVGTSYDPERFGPLPDSGGYVFWKVSNKNTGYEIFSGDGHSLFVPPAKIPPGSYRVEFRGSDASTVVIATSDFTVLDVPDGKTVPETAIITPKAGQGFGTTGDTVSIEFFGVAGDGAETEISGTRYRWVATSDQGTEVVLCEGSAFPDDPYPENTIGDITTPGDGGGFVVVIPRDCRSFTAELGRDPGAGSTTWAVRLEAVDPSTGLVGTDTVAVTVTYVTP